MGREAVERLHRAGHLSQAMARTLTGDSSGLKFDLDNAHKDAHDCTQRAENLSELAASHAPLRKFIAIRGAANVTAVASQLTQRGDSPRTQASTVATAAPAASTRNADA